MAERRQAYLGFYSSLRGSVESLTRIVAFVRNEDGQFTEYEDEYLDTVTGKAFDALNDGRELVPDVELYCTAEAADIARLARTEMSDVLYFLDAVSPIQRATPIEIVDMLDTNQIVVLADRMRSFRAQARKDLGIPE